MQTTIGYPPYPKYQSPDNKTLYILCGVDINEQSVYLN